MFAYLRITIMNFHSVIPNNITRLAWLEKYLFKDFVSIFVNNLTRRGFMAHDPIRYLVEYILFKDKMTIKQFAEHAGLSKQTIYRVLTGRKVSTRSATKIMRYFCYLRQKKLGL